MGNGEKLSLNSYCGRNLFVRDGANVVYDILGIKSIVSKVTLTYDLNYPEQSVPLTSVEVEKGGSLASGNLNVLNPTRLGYEFLGWYKNADLSGELFTENTILEENMTVYAKWEKELVLDKVTLTYDLNYPEQPVPLTSVEVEKGKSLLSSGIRILRPTRAGYTFEGWYFNKDTTGLAFTENSLINENLVVYAKWKKVNVPSDPSINPKPDGPWLGGAYPTITPAPKPEREKHLAYVIGYPDGHVRPEKPITRAEIATILFRLLEEKNREVLLTKSNSFIDVKDGDWFNIAVSTLVKAKVIEGYEDGTFKPQNNITRAELATIISKFSSLKGGSTIFPDTKGHWADKYINSAYASGWIDGYEDGSFRPQREITRAEMAAMINRFLDRAVESENMLPGMIIFVDNTMDKWYYCDIQEATNSHEYIRINKQVPKRTFNYEKWERLIPNPDWTIYEK